MLETGKYRVLNKTRDLLLCDEITLADAGDHHVEMMIQKIVTQPGAGLWLRPCVGAPVADGALPFDMVCIDQRQTVVELYESFQAGSFVLFQSRTTSALIFPARTIAASETQIGDSLDIGLPADLVDEGAQSSEPAWADHPVAVAARPQQQVQPAMQSVAVAAQVATDAPAGEAAEVKEKKKNSFGMRFMRWLVPDRRKAERIAAPGITAQRWAGDRMENYLVEDVSKTGVYLVTGERPFPGTLLMVTLKKRAPLGRQEESIQVQTKVARWGPDGLGLEFVPISSAESAPGESGVTPSQLKSFLETI